MLPKDILRFSELREADVPFDANLCGLFKLPLVGLEVGLGLSFVPVLKPEEFEPEDSFESDLRMPS